MDEDIYKIIGDIIRSTRKSLGLTQDDLGKKIGFSRTSVTNIEKGRQLIQIHTLYKIADALKTDPKLLIPKLEEISRNDDGSSNLSSAEESWLSSIRAKTPKKGDNV